MNGIGGGGSADEAVDRFVSDAEDERASLPYSFAGLLSPVTVESYCAQNWGMRPLHIARRSPHFYSNLITLAELERLFAFHGFFERQLATTPQRGSGPPEPPPVSVGELYERLAGGASLRIRRLETLLDPARPIMVLLRDMERALGHPSDSLSCYVTPGGARGLGPHHDETEIFTLQVRGTKRWRLYHRVSASVPGIHVPDSLGDPVADFILHPGDLLYVPSGWVHDVRAETSSFSMTLVFRAATWATLLALLTASLADHPDFVAPLPAGIADPQSASKVEGLLAHRVDVIAEALKTTTAAELLSAVARSRIQADSSPPDAHLDSLFRADEIELDTVVVRRPGVPAHLQTTGETVQLTLSGGYYLRMHPAAAPALQAVLDAVGPFTVAEMDGELAPAAKVALARRLVVAGVLGCVDAHRSEPADG